MNRLLPWLLLTLLGVIWGTNFLFMKIAVQAIPPLEVAWIRTLAGLLPIAAFAAFTGSLAWRDWRHAHHFCAMALLANVGPYVFFVLGTQQLASGVAGVISGAIPTITAVVVAIALPAERLTRPRVVGIAVGFAGVVMVSPISTGAPMGAGVLFMLAGSVSYALALVYARKFIAPLKLGPAGLASYQMALAFVFMTPFAAPGHWESLAASPAALWALALGLGLLGTGIAFVIYYYLIDTLGALKAASVYYIPPVVALAIGAVFAGEPVGSRQVLGAALIMASIFFASRPERTAVPSN